MKHKEGSQQKKKKRKIIIGPKSRTYYSMSLINITVHQGEVTQGKHEKKRITGKKKPLLPVCFTLLTKTHDTKLF